MIVLPLVLSLSIGLASPLVDPPPVSVMVPKGPREVSLRIDHAALLERESATVVERTASFVHEDATRALADDHGVTLVETAGAAAVVVTLSWMSYEDSIYGVTIETQRPGEPPRVLERFECECINSGLAKAVVERLPAALEQLEPPPTQPPDPAVEGPATDPVDAPPERAPLGAKGKAGIGLLAAGVAGVITGGIVLAQRRRYTEDDPEREVWSGHDFEPPGVAVMAAGAAVVVTGVVLLVVDRVQARSERRARTGIASLTPSRRGLALTFRF